MEDKRTKRITIRLSDSEYTKLKKNFEATTSRKLSEYIRKVLFNRQVTVRVRNESMDNLMEELIAIRSDLNAIGNNFNQVVRRLNTPAFADKSDKWLPVAKHLQEVLLERIEVIQNKISQYSTEWLR